MTDQPTLVSPLTRLEWIPHSRLSANSWNPNSVAPTEMKLLATSLIENGWTQPIVAHPLDDEGAHQIVDGFHRWTLAGQNPQVAALTAGIHPGPNPSPREAELERALLDVLDALDEDAGTGTVSPQRRAARDLLARYDEEDKPTDEVLVPVVTLDPDTDRATRQMATIRHNRARGSHHVLKMADIVVELAAEGLDDKTISRRLGMDNVEVERLRSRGRMATRGVNPDGFSQAWHSEIPEENR